MYFVFPLLESFERHIEQSPTPRRHLSIRNLRFHEIDIVDQPVPPLIVAVRHDRCIQAIVRRG
jgi:hypothetical protein